MVCASGPLFVYLSGRKGNSNLDWLDLNYLSAVQEYPTERSRLAYAGAINPPGRGIGDKEQGEERVRGPYSRKSNSTPLHSTLPQELVR